MKEIDEIRELIRGSHHYVETKNKLMSALDEKDAEITALRQIAIRRNNDTVRLKGALREIKELAEPDKDIQEEAVTCCISIYGIADKALSPDEDLPVAQALLNHLDNALAPDGGEKPIPVCGTCKNKLENATSRPHEPYCPVCIGLRKCEHCGGRGWTCDKDGITGFNCDESYHGTSYCYKECGAHYVCACKGGDNEEEKD